MLQKFAKKFILFIMYILLEYFVFQKTKKKKCHCIMYLSVLSVSPYYCYIVLFYLINS